jgi:Ni,Fe-hydrogenase III small subunit
MSDGQLCWGMACTVLHVAGAVRQTGCCNASDSHLVANILSVYDMLQVAVYVEPR